MRVMLESGRGVAVHCVAVPDPKAAAGLADLVGERVVVFCHSAPGAGCFDPDPQQTRARNVTLLSVDRQGYGGSDADPACWSTVASAADDLAAVLDSFGVNRAGVVGWSAGGRIALALAARRPDLVDRVAVVATPAPDEEVRWLAGTERAAFERLRARDPEQVHAALVERLAPLVPEDPFSDNALWLLAAAQADEPALRVEGARGRLGEMLRAAFAQGPRGLAADIAGYCLQPWGFHPSEVRAKTLLLYGSRDPLAGPTHGRWWESQVPGAQLEVAPGAGHLLIVPMWARVLAHVAPGRAHLRPLDGPWNSDPVQGVEEFSAA
jgi:pimeloyl-ACP methyl ester carboxylesterase